MSPPSRVFVDTSALLALANPRDDLHAAARRVVEALAPTTSLVTTLPVLLETVTLVRRRVTHRRAVELARAVLDSARYEVLHPGAEATEQALEVFARYGDVALSLTDCISFVVMRALGLRQAFAFDDRFRLMGFLLCGDGAGGA